MGKILLYNGPPLNILKLEQSGINLILIVAQHKELNTVRNLKSYPVHYGKVRFGIYNHFE